FHREENRDTALAVRDLHMSGRCRLVVLDFTFLEVLNAIRFSPRADEEVGHKALGILQRLRLQVEPLGWDLLRKSNAIAWAYRIALYDAAYVALAERLGFPLLT